ncbi:MAG: DNA-directed RNA polymerase subunit beta [Lentisphaeria bacterium]|nr:DNA-directed RNA polymerase subunit beta [Lentisphaeria bacterium]
MPDRLNFGKLEEVLEIPDLIGIQLDSYASFLQLDTPPEKRQDKGLQGIFREVFPVESFGGDITLNFLSYTIGTPKKEIVDCIKDGESYTASLHVNFELINKGVATTESVYMGEIPMMTPHGSFVINGAERVIISQLHRSPGICFEKRRHSTGRFLYSYRIIPDRGSWLEVQFDIYGHIFIFLDRHRKRRKFLITTFFRALGYSSNEDIVRLMYDVKKMTPAQLIKSQNISEYYTYEPILDANKNQVVDPFIQMTESHAKSMAEAGIKSANFAWVPNEKSFIINCLSRDPADNTDAALKEIYKRMRPGDPPSIENARSLLEHLFFDKERYDLGLVGRYKINEHLGLNIDENCRILTHEDLIEATKYLMDLYSRSGQTDDIDHLGARRVRPVGELLQNHCRVGLLRTKRFVKEHMSLMTSSDTVMTPLKLINQKLFISVVREFFARNQLSQFMDQTNPLSELTNKRRLSALGPGGLSRDRAGFEVRDIHSSHYGRICPIETPEGPNIGLISSMSLYSRINHFGFLETPYRRVENGVVTDKIDYLTADKEEQFVIAQANAPLTPEHTFVNPTVMSRFQGESAEHPREEVQLMDVSPKQLVSGAAGLIPFLEHDDANRALMGSNMQRQAVPLMTTDSPYVGTGLERKIAIDSRAVLCADRDGIVAEVSADHIVITSDGKVVGETADKNPTTYRLIKFLRSNAGTCVNQVPIVRSGMKVRKGDPIADGAATQGAELALGKNVRAAYMPWCGYNFEDAIVLSERLVKEDVYTSLHIDEFEVESRETKLGNEEITGDLPNVGEEALRNLDMNGIVRLGTEVKPGDILVGKITPKSETELAPEERLLRAIFGEKAADVKDSSLTVPSGKGGIVMDIRIEYAKESGQQTMTKTEQKRALKRAKDTYKEQFSSEIDSLSDRLTALLLGQKLPKPIYTRNEEGETVVLVTSNRKVTRPSIAKLALAYNNWSMEECETRDQLQAIFSEFIPRFNVIEQNRIDAMNIVNDNSNEDRGPIKRVKVYVASKRKIQVGDKMAGRHGNKGIVSRIVPIEDMPFTKDGRPVDIVLNPLGVPSRMNIGQVLEAHLGWAVSMLGVKVATPVFDGISEEKIIDMMREANAKVEQETGENFHWGFKTVNGEEVFDGKTDLYDGRTGNRFDQRVMVGVVYMLKLDHLVANKIHARSVGPYSLVTQQPLGGKAQHGGQRFGEMEVWALEAYGAAHTLQEMLTVKSDDVTGRARIYESIVRGQNILEPGRPESFNVLLKELQSLGLDVRTVKRSENPSK